MTTTNNTTFEAGKSKQKKCQAIKSIKSHKTSRSESSVFSKNYFLQWRVPLQQAAAKVI